MARTKYIVQLDSVRWLSLWGADNPGTTTDEGRAHGFLTKGGAELALAEARRFEPLPGAIILPRAGMSKKPAHDPPEAALADSSLYVSPTGGGRYHIFAEGGIALCGQAVFLVENTLPLERVSEVLRCRRVGCRKWWPPTTAP